MGGRTLNTGARKGAGQRKNVRSSDVAIYDSVTTNLDQLVT